MENEAVVDGAEQRGEEGIDVSIVQWTGAFADWWPPPSVYCRLDSHSGSRMIHDWTSAVSSVHRPPLMAADAHRLHGCTAATCSIALSTLFPSLSLSSLFRLQPTRAATHTPSLLLSTSS